MDQDADGLSHLLRKGESEETEGARLDGLPFARELGMRLISSGDGEAVLSIPYDPRMIGDPESRVISGGVVTALLDTCGGVAVMASRTRPVSAATLDLRIDYMRPATPERVLYARASCFRETRSITFVRASAYHDTPDAPVATAIGAFMVENRRVWPAPSAETEA